MNKAEQLPLALESRPATGRDAFHIGASNAEAIHWIDRWPNWPAPILFISGPAASGKTHLSAVWEERSNAARIPAQALHQKSADDILKAAEHLIIDGLDPWLGDLRAETTLFHLYNILKENQRTALITMRMAPNQTDFALPDLASRFRAAPLVRIDAPDDILLGSVLIKLFSDRQLSVSNDVIKYILPRMERSFAAAAALVARADHIALAQKRGISVPLMREVLSTVKDLSHIRQ
jgi:DnaA regulatory inactivator Hda